MAAIAVIATSAHAAPDPLVSLTREVSKLRGLRAKQRLASEHVDRAELRKRLDALASDQQTRRDAEDEGIAYARWGLVPITTDYVQLRLDLLSDQIAGYYDPRARKLTITTDPATSSTGDAKWAELVLAHEIVHGLQDQTFDLRKLTDLPETEGDALLARHAVIEGDGVALMIELALSRQGLDPPWGNPTIASDVVRAMAGPTGDSLDRAPLAIRETMLFPYRDGFGFVAARLRHGGWSAVNTALRRPPRSTEQILHPDKYASDEKPVVVPLASPPYLDGMAVVHSTVWGELGFALWLRSHGIPADVAAIAAEGWGGDRVLVVAPEGERDPARTVGLARFEWDSETDAIEAFNAASRTLDAAVTGTTAEQTDTRIVWLGLDGKVTVLERTGTTLDITLGAPAARYANR